MARMNSGGLGVGEGMMGTMALATAWGSRQMARTCGEELGHSLSTTWAMDWYALSLGRFSCSISNAIEDVTKGISEKSFDCLHIVHL